MQTPSFPPIAGIVFDLDGCLIDSEIISLDVLSTLLQSAGIAEATAEMLRDNFMGVSLTGILTMLSARAGITLPSDLAQRFEAEVCRRYRENLSAMDGAHDLLADLTARGVALAIATGSSVERMHLALETLGLARFFNGTACSTDEVANGKPAPDLFLLAAARMGLAPQNCIAIDDSPHGITGAHRAGMHGYGFVGGSHLVAAKQGQSDRLRAAGALAVLDRFSDLPALIAIPS